MNPVKIFGGVLLVLGLVLRAISAYVLRQRELSLRDTVQARKRFARAKRNAYFIDALFIAMGIYCIIRA